MSDIPVPEDDGIRLGAETVPYNGISIFTYKSSALLQTSKYRIARNVVIKSMDSLYPTVWFYRLMTCYLIMLVLKYLSVFLQIPFEAIENRPAICILNALFDVILVRCHTFLSLEFHPIVSPNIQRFL